MTCSLLRNDGGLLKAVSQWFSFHAAAAAASSSCAAQTFTCIILPVAMTGVNLRHSFRGWKVGVGILLNVYHFATAF